MLRLAPPALVVALLVAPAAARAATVEMSASSGPAADTFIDYRAASGEANRLVVRKSGNRITFTDSGVRRLTAKPNRYFGNCVRISARSARCPAATAVIRLGNRDDRVSFVYPGTGDDAIPTDPLELADPFVDTEGGFLETVNVDGGTGDDVIGGTPFDDIIAPGAGKDRVSAGGGQDTIALNADGSRDVLKGGAGLNELDYFSSAPVTVDTRLGLASSGSGSGLGSGADVIRGFRRIIGSPGADTLRGGDAGEAIYGAGGRDTIDGRGGDDYLAGDVPILSGSFADNVRGGDGNDVIDVRDRPLAPTSTVDCGPGADRIAAQEDDRLTSCESSAFQDYYDPSTSFLWNQDPEFSLLTPIAPVARGADGTPTYDVPCPGGTGAQPCTGTVVLERPPTTPTGTPEQLGSGPFSIPPGGREDVTVALNDAGRAALASPGAVLSIRVHGSIPPPPAYPSATARTIDFGWQTTF